jgi:tetratricopeptide (TPR) repeat protein
MALAHNLHRHREDAQALALYGRLLAEGAEPLTERQRLLAHFQRGALAAKLGRSPEAIADLRAALRIDHLHPGALRSLADVFTSQERVGSAVQHYVQALLVEDDGAHRARLYARLGWLWDERLASPEDASVYYDLALGAGASERDLMLRALKLYIKRGRADRALQVVEQLVPRTDDAAELAELWATKADVLASRDEEQAMEAYDMALSYGPTHEHALSGLTALLERRGEWEQILELYEARAETGAPQARSTAYRHLAKLARERFQDDARAEKYLRAAIALAPTREDWQALLGALGDDPDRVDERRTATAGLLGCAGPWMPQVIDLGRRLHARGERRSAWTLLSPLLAVSVIDQGLKPLVAELRKEFDKADNVDALDPAMHVWARHPDVDNTLFELVVDLDNTVPLGPTRVDELGIQGLVSADLRSGAGKIFATIAGVLGLEGATLARAENLPRPIVIIDGDRPEVILKNELVQLIANSETSFLYTLALELTRPGARLYASLAPEERPRVVPALLAAVELRPATTPEIGAMAARIVAGTTAQQRDAWRARLEDAPWLDDGGLGVRFAEAVLETARRVGVVATTDLRGAARLLARVDEAVPRFQNLGRVDELEQYLASAPGVRSLYAFAASTTYGRLVTPPA